MTENNNQKERNLEENYPWIPWADPQPMTILGGRTGYACRYCVAIHGYRPSEGKLPGFDEERSEVLEHIRKEHNQNKSVEVK